MGLFKRSMFLGMVAIAILEGFAQAENTLRGAFADKFLICLLYTSPSPRDTR